MTIQGLTVNRSHRRKKRRKKQTRNPSPRAGPAFRSRGTGSARAAAPATGNGAQTAASASARWTTPAPPAARKTRPTRATACAAESPHRLSASMPLTSPCSGRKGPWPGTSSRSMPPEASTMNGTTAPARGSPFESKTPGSPRRSGLICFSVLCAFSL